MKRLLCIRLPSWPIQRLVVAQPELKGRPIILHAPERRGGSSVVACSRAAYRQGVRAGMPLAEAEALARQGLADASTMMDGPRRHGPRPGDEQGGGVESAVPGRGEPYVAEHDGRADAATLDQLARWCECFTPLVGFEQLEGGEEPGAAAARRSDCLYLDVTNLGTYFGGEGPLARRVAEAFAHRGYTVRVALADTLGAAWALAHFGTPWASMVEWPAAGIEGGERAPGAQPGAQPGGGTRDRRLASSFLIAPPGETIEMLRPLPIRALRLPPSTESLLEQLGIVRLEQLASLPRSSLLARFGEVLLKRWDQACGRREEVLWMHRPPARFQVDWTLEHPTDHRAAIGAILAELIKRLTLQLREQGEGVVQCVCHLSCGQQRAVGGEHTDAPAVSHPLQLRVGLFQPTAWAEHLQQLFQMQLDRIHLPGAVQHVVLEAPLTSPLQSHQRELFAGGPRHASWQLAQLVDRLSSRLGAASVVRPHRRHEALPERAFQDLPLTGQRRRTAPSGRRGPRAASRGAASRRSSRSSGKRGSAASRAGSRPRRLIRPLHLRWPPWPLEVVALAPDGPPLRLLFGQRVYRVTRCWGPERIETGWWRGASVRRDYYRLETHSGHWLWVFRQLHDGQWFLHGLFG